MDDTTSLVLGVDSSQVKSAADTLDKFAASGKRAETSATAFEAAAAGIGGVAPKANATAAALSAAQKQSAALGATNKLSAFQAQQLSFQLNDLAVQVASGQSPITALIQQGSQLSGTFGGVGNALRAVGTIFTTARVLIGGAAGSFAAFAYAAYQGRQESSELRKALALTGNAAGITEGQFNGLSQSIAKATGSGVGVAREALQGLVADGRFSGEALTETARAAVLFGKATGASSEEVLKGFSNMRGGVAKWAEETNRQYHFLNASQLEYIRTLEDQGDSQKAIATTMAALSDRVQGAAADVGTLEKAWTNAKNAVSGFVDAAKSVGRASTIDDTLNQAKETLARLKGAQAGAAIARPGEVLSGLLNGGNFNSQISAQEKLVASLEASKKLGEDVAKAQAEKASRDQAEIAFGKLKESSLTKQEQLAKAIANANALADKAGISAEDRARVLADIRQKFYSEPAKTSLATDLAAIQRNLNSTIDAYSNAESILEANRAASLLNESDYYEAKRAFIRLNSEAEVKALQDENARIAAEKINGRDAIEIQNKRQEAQKQIADNTARIAIIQADATARSIVLDTQQGASIANVTRGYLEAKIAAEDYLRALTLQSGRDLAAVGQSDRERSSASARAQIEDRYNQQRQELENNRVLLEAQGKFTEDQRKQYSERLAIVNDYQAKALASFEENYAAISAAESNWVNGASRAFKNYVDEAENSAKRTESAFTKAINGFEDALTQFVTTGKSDFKSLAQSIIADIIRVQIQAALSSIFSSFTGGFAGAATGGTESLASSNIPGRASGGAVGAGGLFRVNEKGPELLSVGGQQFLMMGNQPGSVTPNSKLRGSSPVFDFSGASYQFGSNVSRGEVMGAIAAGNAKLEENIRRSLRQSGVA